MYVNANKVQGNLNSLLKCLVFCGGYLISVTAALKVAGCMVMGSYTVQARAIKHFGITLSKQEMSASWVL